jgi:preprotein translocase subunit SecY
VAEATGGIIKNSELRKRITFTLILIAVYRLGVHVPTPGVDGSTVLKFFQNQGGIFGLFNTFSGGALNQFSV